MDFKYLFTSFEGRIGRQQWWLGTIVLLIAGLVLYYAILPIIGLSLAFDPAAGPDALVSIMRKAAIGQIVMLLILGYPTTALMKKRLNDRDRPNWMAGLFWAPTVVSVIMGVLGLNFTTTEMNGVAIPAPSMLSMVVGLASLVIGLWALVELGFLRGTEGANQHGSDPVPLAA